MNQQILSADKPITHSKEDFLGRKDFSDAVSNAIINYPKDHESLTIGLYGKWGSGKTSIINMISNEIELEKDILIFNFQPWIYSDTEQLISYFFREFAKVIKYKDNALIALKLGEELETYASFFEPISLIPEPTVSFISMAGSKVFGSVGKISKKWGKLKSKDLSGTKESIEKHLKELNEKIVIIVDDIDRLNNTEIRQVFQMIKVLGNFPNTIYLTSMDRDVVTDALSEVQKGDGNEYLEKIINIPFEVPMPSISKLHNLLFSELNAIIGEKNDLDEDYFSSVFRSGYKEFFKNIRDINRYINILRFNYSMVKGEIDIVDLFVITAFQVFEPKIYEYLKYNRQIVLLAETYYKDEDKDKAINNFKDITSKLLVKLTQDDYLKLIGSLFPEMDADYKLISQEECTKKARISSPDFYNLYFQMSLNEDNIGKEEMSQYINATLDEKEFIVTINNLVKSKRIGKFLERLAIHLEYENFSQLQVQNIANTFIDLGDSFLGDDENLFGSMSLRVESIIDMLIKKFDKDTRFAIIKEAINRSLQSIAIPSNIVIENMIEHGQYSGKRAEHEDNRMLLQEDLEELKKIILIKIEQKVKDDSLQNSNDFVRILYLWKKLDEEKFKHYINNLIEFDEKLLLLLQEFVGVQHSSRSGSTLTFNYKDIHEIVEPNNLVDKVNNIFDKKEFDLSDKEKFSLEEFLKLHNKVKDNS